MSDDIVLRLRKRAENDLHDLIDLASRPTSLADEAADEIERLRTEVVRLRSFLHPIGAVINGQAVRDE